jgi:uncharacterized membrane protein YfcA
MNLLATIDDLQGFALLAGASLLAGAVNSFAGGGTILTFPVLAAILPDLPGRLVTANTTSTIGLVPGSAAAAWAYRGDRSGMPAWARGLVVPSVAGAIVGTWLLLALPPRLFDALVPWLILTAAVLFAMQPRLTAVARGPDRPASPAAVAERHAAAAPPARVAAVWGLQFLVSIYGGYFGAGLGILTLAVLGTLGLGDIHRLNGVKNMLAMVINGVAAGVYAVGSLAGWQAVSWPHAGVMAVASIAGSSAASHVARRLPARIVRRCVALIGFALAAYYFWRH